jgi:hypothetical protein
MLHAGAAWSVEAWWLWTLPELWTRGLAVERAHSSLDAAGH